MNEGRFRRLRNLKMTRQCEEQLKHAESSARALEERRHGRWSFQSSEYHAVRQKRCPHLLAHISAYPNRTIMMFLMLFSGDNWKHLHLCISMRSFVTSYLVRHEFGVDLPLVFSVLYNPSSSSPQSRYRVHCKTPISKSTYQLLSQDSLSCSCCCWSWSWYSYFLSKWYIGWRMQFTSTSG